MNRSMSIEELRGILIACAGGEDADAPHEDFADLAFDDLGYDSLALIETATRLKLDHGVVIPDDLITEVATPAELLKLVNDRIAA
ncbi:acyl carrier protein [Streptomyces sp. NPDC052109]|uniref:acyl carrier protein n=1 Tax=Streptomyces sp. NPDC052109 TaxID=3155527 RepID=UPI00342A3A75